MKSYKVMDINVKKKLNMGTKHKIRFAMINKKSDTHITHVHIYVNLNLLQPKLWSVVQFKEQWAK